MIKNRSHFIYKNVPDLLAQNVTFPRIQNARPLSALQGRGTMERSNKPCALEQLYDDCMRVLYENSHQSRVRSNSLNDERVVNRPIYFSVTATNPLMEPTVLYSFVL